MAATDNRPGNRFLQWAMRVPQRDGVLIGAIIAFAIVVWWPTLHSGFVLDDRPLILNNRAIGSWSFLWKGFVNEFHWFKFGEGLRGPGNYRPIQALMLGVSYQLFGRWPLGWHAELILFHLLAVLAAYRSARILSPNRAAALLTAATFALMPVQAGAVAYCSAIQPLAGALFLWSFATAARRKGPARLLTSVLAYTAALLCYEGAIVLPILVAAYQFLLGENAPARPDRLRAALASVLPFLPPTLWYVGVRLWVMGPAITAGSPTSASDVFLTLPAALVQYLTLLTWPFAAGPVHPLSFVTTVRSPQFLVPALLLAMLATAGVLATVRSPLGRLYSFGAIWIALTLSPVLMLGGHVLEFMIQDRWLYIPMFGYSLIACTALTGAARARISMRRFLTMAGLIYGVACVLGLYQAQGYWKDGVAFYSRAIELEPNDAMYHDGLAWAYFDRGDFGKAEPEFAAAARLNPSDPMAALNLAAVRGRVGPGGAGALAPAKARSSPDGLGGR